MMIRRIHADNPVNNVSESLSKVSLTVPDDSLTVKELFEKYVTGTINKEEILALRRQAVYDGDNPSFSDYTPDLDANEAYEISEHLKDLKALQALDSPDPISDPDPAPVPSPTPEPSPSPVSNPKGE